MWPHNSQYGRFLTDFIIDFIGFQKVISRPNKLCAFLRCNRFVGGGEAFVGFCSDLHKDNRSGAVGYYQINFAQFAGEVACDCFEAFLSQKSFAVLLTPTTEQSAVF